MIRIILIGFLLLTACTNTSNYEVDGCEEGCEDEDYNNFSFYGNNKSEELCEVESENYQNKE